MGQQQDWAPVVRRCAARCGVVRHPGSSLKPGVPYQPMPFPEFADVASQRPTAWLEWVTVLRHCRQRGRWPRTVLDLGANIGMHTYLWAQLGCRVVAVESDRANVHVLSALKRWAGLGEQVVVRSSIEDAIALRWEYDLTLCLNLHQWLEQELGPRETVRCLRRAFHQSRWVAFQTVHAQAYGNVKMARLKTQRDCLAYLQACGKPTVSVIGKSGYRKPRWTLWGE